MSDFDLEVVDSLEALVIVDNELDPMSPAAPDTVQVSGLMPTLAMQSPHKVSDRGDACKELRMTDICCSAHGLSILVVSLSSKGRKSGTSTNDAFIFSSDGSKGRQEAFCLVRLWTGRRSLGKKCKTTAP